MACIPGGPVPAARYSAMSVAIPQNIGLESGSAGTHCEQYAEHHRRQHGAAATAGPSRRLRVLFYLFEHDEPRIVLCLTGQRLEYIPRSETIHDRKMPVRYM
jgi:hypothetical protein